MKGRTENSEHFKKSEEFEKVQAREECLRARENLK